jgi:hypothetical protein
MHASCMQTGDSRCVTTCNQDYSQLVYVPSMHSASPLRPRMHFCRDINGRLSTCEPVQAGRERESVIDREREIIGRQCRRIGAVYLRSPQHSILPAFGWHC